MMKHLSTILTAAMLLVHSIFGCGAETAHGHGRPHCGAAERCAEPCPGHEQAADSPEKRGFPGEEDRPCDEHCGLHFVSSRGGERVQLPVEVSGAGGPMWSAIATDLKPVAIASGRAGFEHSRCFADRPMRAVLQVWLI